MTMRLQTPAPELRGTVFDIERCAIHDGPGIRTLVFLKGCPLRCLWCANPESQRRAPELMFHEKDCDLCGRCIPLCPEHALSIGTGQALAIDWALCTNCGACCDVCPSRAVRIVGRQMSVGELVEEIEKDRPFYRRSGGGVTLGGGEPTLQAAFAAALLAELRRRFLHTAIETCGYALPEALLRVVEHCDLVYFDVKSLDPETHAALTGVGNDVILENLRRVAERTPVVVRIPVVPGCTDVELNIRRTTEFVARLGPNVQRIELLPYHSFGETKYRRLGRPYPLTGTGRPDDERLLHLRHVVAGYGVRAAVGR
ncbi:MAG TPA: glycyl-radical enzyme activating protein [Candidatus Binatia bacterium]|nr:glycyl-radical enzyme activating protein [Candidatus Binatia bacterium]